MIRALPSFIVQSIRRGMALLRTRPGLSACASEGGAATASPTATSVALLATHLVRDGELVLLMLRPSRWFIVLVGLRFIAAAALLALLATALDSGNPNRVALYVEAGILLVVGRLMWGVLQWMGRLYILTDMRIIRISGVFNVEVFDCALRKVARTLIEATVKEKIVRIGSLTVVPQSDEAPVWNWQMIARPGEVHQTVLQAIRRANQGG